MICTTSFSNHRFSPGHPEVTPTLEVDECRDERHSLIGSILEDDSFSQHTNMTMTRISVFFFQMELFVVPDDTIILASS